MRYLLLSLILILLSEVVQAKPVCEFENTGHRRVSPNNEKDWQCMKKLAAAGDVFYQSYIGPWLLSGRTADGKSVEQGLYWLKMAARSTNQQIEKSINPKPGNAKGRAMQMLAGFYLADDDTISHDYSSYYGGAFGQEKIYQLRDKHELKDVALAFQWYWLMTQQPTHKIFNADEEFKALLTVEQMNALKQTAKNLLKSDQK